MNHRRVALASGLLLIALPSSVIARERSKPAKARGNPGDWFPVNSYPAEAKRNGQQGRVSVQLTIDKTGAPTACVVVSSSGAPSLDKATCDLALANGKFTPALDAKGQPVETTFALPGVRWELHDSPPVKLAGPWRVGAKLQIDTAGKVVSCSEQRAGPAPTDVQMCVVTAEMPPEFGRFARGSSTAPMAELVLESSLSIDGAPALPMTYEADSRETIMMMVMHVDVNTDGTVSNCQVEAQSGPSITNTCADPPGPFLPIDKPTGVRVKFAMSRPAAAVTPSQP